MRIRSSAVEERVREGDEEERVIRLGGGQETCLGRNVSRDRDDTSLAPISHAALA